MIRTASVIGFLRLGIWKRVNGQFTSGWGCWLPGGNDRLGWLAWARGACRGFAFCMVGAPVSGAIWGGAFGRAGHAVRTGAVRRSGGAPTGDDPWVVGAPVS